MSLENCIQIALGNNPEIASAIDEILISDCKLRQIWSKYFPTLSWQTGWSHIKQLQLSDALRYNLEYEYYILGSISIDQMLYDFGVTQNKATVQRLTYQGSKETLCGIINDVVYRTKNSYYKLQYAYESLTVAQNTVDKYKDFYNQAKALYQIGFNPKVDVTIALANLSSAKIELIKAQNLVNTSIVELNNVMGVPNITKYKINEKLEYLPINITFEKAIEIANNYRPELKLAQINTEKALQTYKLAKKSFYPVIDTKLQYQRGGRHWNSNDGWSVGVYANFYNINGIEINNKIKEAKYRYDKELANTKKIQNNAYLEIQKSFLKLIEKKNQIPVSEIQIKQAKENFDLSKGRYRVGEASPIEMREAENTLRNSQLTYYKSIYEYNSTVAELEKVIGQNIAKNPDFYGSQK